MIFVGKLIFTICLSYVGAILINAILINRFLQFKPKGIQMAKSDFIAAQLASIQAQQAKAVSDGLSATWDESATEQKSSDGTLTQADLDAAVKAATDPLNAQIATVTAKDAADVQALADAQAKATSDLAALQAKVDAAVAADTADKALVTNLQSAVGAVQTSLDAIKAAVAAVITPPSK